MSIRYQPYGVLEPQCFLDVKANPRVRRGDGAGRKRVAGPIIRRQNTGQQQQQWQPQQLSRSSILRRTWSHVTGSAFMDVKARFFSIWHVKARSRGVGRT